jgi:small acid-soluble spore protein H (minor)
MKVDPKRASEIVASPNMVNVTYNGIPIYIESIMGDNATALVHPMDQPKKQQKVSIASLIEQ